MNLLFSLSGEHPLLPRAEIFATLEGEGIDYHVFSESKNKRTLILDVDTENPLFINRLSMTKKVGEFIGASKNLEELVKILNNKMIEETFAVESESQYVRETLGKEIWKLGYGVDLLNPDSRILCLQDDDNRYNIAIETPVERGFNRRRPHKRPYFHPTSLKPKIARVLVNLARVKEGDTVLDPFCGAGGILIEAGLMNMAIRGCDVAEEMLEGCTKNLKHYGLRGEIIENDALKLENLGGRVDAIVTDLPYGRSSFMTDRNNERFYSRFLSSAAKKLDSGKHLVAVIPDSINLRIDREEFEVKEEYSLYVHRSLTRKIFVLRRR